MAGPRRCGWVVDALPVLPGRAVPDVRVHPDGCLAEHMARVLVHDMSVLKDALTLHIRVGSALLFGRALGRALSLRSGRLQP